MRKDEIPRDEWPRFFEAFMSSHLGHVCSLLVLGRDDEARLSLNALFLAAVGADDERIRVLLANCGGDQLGYIINAPSHVFLEKRRPDDVNEILRIDAAAGRTVMTFDAVD